MPSRWDILGQELERMRNPLSFDIKASIRPWTVHSDMLPENREKAEKKEKDREKSDRT